MDSIEVNRGICVSKRIFLCLDLVSVNHVLPFLIIVWIINNIYNTVNEL